MALIVSSVHGQSQGRVDMVLIKSFCVIFTIRLGSIIIGVSNLVESFVCFVLSVLWMTADPVRTTEVLEILDDANLLYFSDILHRISKDPSPYREVLLSVSCLRLADSLLLIYAAYYMKPLFLLPFLAVELVRDCFLLFLHVTGMQLVKENSQNLGLLIVVTLAGSFLLLFLFYTWACVCSLFQVLWMLRSKGSPRTPNRKPHFDSQEFPPKLYPAYSMGSYMAPVY